MNGSRLIRFGIGVLVASVALPGVAGADSPTLNPSGALTLSWRGDPARGCQAAGVCNVAGSLNVIALDQSGSSESPRARDISIQDNNAVARVSDPGSTPGQPHVCTNLVVVNVTLVILRARPAGLRASVAGSFSPPSSGDCAGPLPADLGAITLPARRLPGPREAYDLSSVRAFGAGPYEVTVRSTIRARRPASSSAVGGGIGSTSVGSSSGPHPRTALVERASLQYRISNAVGTATTTFAGRPDPFCLPLDACGVSGSVTDTISGGSTLIDFEAQRIVKRRLSRGAVLADLRSGRLPILQTGALLGDALSASVAWSAGSTCVDRLQQLNALGLVVRAAKGARNLSLAVTSDQGTQDPLRNHCPGPSGRDLLGGQGGIVSGSLPRRSLGGRRLQAVMTGRGAFVAGGYTGARSGRVSLGLQLVRVRTGTSSEQVFGGAL